MRMLLVFSIVANAGCDLAPAEARSLEWDVSSPPNGRHDGRAACAVRASFVGSVRRGRRCEHCRDGAPSGTLRNRGRQAVPTPSDDARDAPGSAHA